MLHLHCVDDWLDLYVHNLFHVSLDYAMRWSSLSLVFRVCRRSAQQLVPRFAPLECWEWLHDLLVWITSTIFS